MIGQALPLFESGNLLTKEMLTSIRDYSFGFSELLYEGYGNGILKGCKVTTTEDTIRIGRGIVVYEGKLYLILNQLIAAYYPTDQLAIFKLQFKDEIRTQGFIYRELEVMVTNDLELSNHDVEICRFKLQTGSKLRIDYRTFKDRETEYDTANMTYTPYAAYGESSLSPDITTDFARRMMKCKDLTPLDTCFCLQALNTSGTALSKETISMYIKAKLEMDHLLTERHTLYKHLCTILESAEEGRNIARTRMTSKNRILID